MTDKQVLLVDGDELVATQLINWLERSGVRVAVAQDGRVALAMTRMDRPDLVLLNVITPVVGAYALLTTMDRDPDLRDVPVVVMSTRDRIDADMDHKVPHLYTPLTAAKLKRLIRKVLGDVSAGGSDSRSRAGNGY